MGVPPPPPPSKSWPRSDHTDEELKMYQMQIETQMQQLQAETENIFEEMNEELDNMMDFGLDFDLDEIAEAVDEVVSEELGTKAQEILDEIRRPNRGKTVSNARYEFGIEGGPSYPASPNDMDNATVDGVPVERLEDQLEEWHQKLSKWLCDNTDMNMGNVRGMANDELIQLAQVLYEYTMANGEFKHGHSEAVTKEWFKLKANRAEKRIKKKELLENENTKRVLELIKDDWRYRIKEILRGDGCRVFFAQRRSWWTLGLIWESSSHEHNLESAVEVVERWLKKDVKDQVTIHGETPRTFKGDRNQIIQAMRERQMNALKKIHVNRSGDRSGPPRPIPPPPESWMPLTEGKTRGGNGYVNPQSSLPQRPIAPPPPPGRVRKEGEQPSPFEVEIIPGPPEGPPNEIIGGNYRSSGPYAGANHYADRSMTPEQEQCQAEFEEEKNTVVDLKRNLLD